ncbi:MAG TPA: hypothetical protein PK523_09575, partial [Elusimicrobiales bacterium]|nr:hypothetical protein [Elusimicrobiales bacterium]
MKVLLIAPLPPPMTGQSLASKIFAEELGKSHLVRPVNISKESFTSGADSPGRFLKVLGFLREIWRERRSADAVYLTVSESLAGNLKDLVIYLICSSRLGRTYIHLHGGSLKRRIFDGHPLLARINRFFMRSLGGAIITGRAHAGTFEGILPPEKVHVVPNFAEDYLFSGPGEVEAKFSGPGV